MLKNWRAWVLLILLVGPILAYIGFGALWLKERHWLLIAGGIWIASGVVFSILAARWTKSAHAVMPPIDWDAPETFSQFDREAWDLVQKEAEQGDSIAMEDLSTFDVYMNTGRRLARRLAAHYHPLSNDPIENVAVSELLTALELAAEDLNGLCRQVPGGDLITPAHWKQAVQAAGYIQRANDIYSYLLPIIQPWTGLVRLGAQKLMVNPAWKDMQQNLMRWFYRAFVNRLGTHLIELYSGRLAIGADLYRKLTRKTFTGSKPAVHAEVGPTVVGLAGARGSGKSVLLDALRDAQAQGLGKVKAKLVAAGLDDTTADRLKDVQFEEIPDYTAHPGEETARDRSTRRGAIEEAAEVDLLILVVDGGRDDASADVRFIQAWDLWFVEHRGLETPPALAVVTGVDRPDWGGPWSPPHDWETGRGLRETAVRAKLQALRAALPPSIAEVVAVGLAEGAPYGVSESLLPAVAALLHRAERVALIRHLRDFSTRSKARRLISQIGVQGRRLWGRWRPTADASHAKDR